MGISATLYAKIPFAGRIKLAEFKGSLISGISVKINLALAKGSAVVSAKPNASGKHDLYINLKLKIKFVKEFNTGDIKLFGLPYVHFFDVFPGISDLTTPSGSKSIQLCAVVSLYLYLYLVCCSDLSMKFETLKKY